MSTLVVMASVFALAGGGALLLRRRLEEALPLSGALIVGVQYAFGLFGWLSAGFYAALALCAVCLLQTAAPVLAAEDYPAPDVSGKTLERMRREKHLLIVLALSGGGKLQHHAVRRIKELIQIFQKHAFAVHEMLYHILDVKTNAVPLVAEFFCNHNLSPL